MELINKAIKVATKAHAGQTRKGSDLPYIAHPFACAMLARQYIDDAEVIAACLLHDVLEDVEPTIYNKAEMLEDFGEGVVGLVQAVSEPKTAGEAHEKPWKERKDAYLKQLEDAKDKRAAIVSCADKICNLSDMLQSYKENGEEIWACFKADKAQQLWFYRQCYAEADGNVPDGMMEVFRALLCELEEVVGA